MHHFSERFPGALFLRRIPLSRRSSAASSDMTHGGLKQNWLFRSDLMRIRSKKKVLRSV